jgi:SAM-dependent methyltransferase
MVDYEKINLQQKESAERSPFTLERYRQFFRYFPPNARTVLDVGCSTGRGGKILYDLNPKLLMVGLDCVKERLDSCPPNVYKRKLCSYSTNIASEDETFDVIVAGEFIEHLHPSDIDTSLAEFFRVIRCKGRLLLTTPNPDYIRLKLTGKRVKGGAHLSEHYRNELRERLEKVGFSQIKFRGSGRMSRFLGERFPLFSFYGSYLAIADKLCG